MGTQTPRKPKHSLGGSYSQQSRTPSQITTKPDFPVISIDDIERNITAVPFSKCLRHFNTRSEIYLQNLLRETYLGIKTKNELSPETISTWQAILDTKRYSKKLPSLFGNRFTYALKQDIGRAKKPTTDNSAPKTTRAFYVKQEALMDKKIRTIPWWRCLFNLKTRKTLYCRDLIKTLADKATITDSDKIKWNLAVKTLNLKKRVSAQLFDEVMTTLSAANLRDTKPSSTREIMRVDTDKGLAKKTRAKNPSTSIKLNFDQQVASILDKQNAAGFSAAQVDKTTPRNLNLIIGERKSTFEAPQQPDLPSFFGPEITPDNTPQQPDLPPFFGEEITPDNTTQQPDLPSFFGPEITPDNNPQQSDLPPFFGPEITPDNNPQQSDLPPFFGEEITADNTTQQPALPSFFGPEITAGDSSQQKIPTI